MMPIISIDGDALEAEFAAGERVRFCGLMVTSRGILNEGEATVTEIDLVGRAAKPPCVRTLNKTRLSSV